MNATNTNPSIRRWMLLGSKRFWLVVSLITVFGPGLGPAMMAYASAGDLDTTFSNNGRTMTDFFGLPDVAYGVAIQADGKIVAAGTTSLAMYGLDFALARYNPGGALDDNFDGDGRVTTPILGTDRGYAVAIQSDGKIVVAGSAKSQSGPTQFALARYNPDGSLDTSFSSNGIQVTAFGSHAVAQAMTIQPDGKIVVAGYGAGSDTDFALARYNTNGDLDTIFSNDGKLTTDFGAYDAARAVAIQADGKIVVAGYSAGSDTDFALARYNTNGDLDSNFSFDGKLTTDFLGDVDRAYAVMVQPDGKIVAGGEAWAISNNKDFALARYTSDGLLDTSFSGNGKAMTGFGGDDVIHALALQADGKILAAGEADLQVANDFGLARYNTNGDLDTSFSGNGKVKTDFPAASTGGGAYAIALQADGKIVLAGTAGDNFALARYLAP